MQFSIPAGDEKSKYVQAGFTRIAEKYDLFNDLFTLGLHRYWKRFLVNKANLKAGDRALDFCCGTGDITELLEKAVGPQGMVIGLDFSEGMLKTARTRDGGESRRLLQGDAMSLPVSDTTLDAATVGYGLRNLAEIQPCLNEVYRILKPGGRFLIIDVGKVKLPVVKQLFDFYFRNIVPLIGKVLYPGEDMFDYFPESSVKYPSQDKMKTLLTETGFTDVTYYNFGFGGTVVHYALKPKNG